jgi:two-component SAPR family response regulator
MKELYEKLRRLISDNYCISITDSEGHSDLANVGVASKTASYRLVHFSGKTIEEALEKAIQKFEHPEQDYLDEAGFLWKANENSCFSENHIRSFLKPRPERMAEQ